MTITGKKSGNSAILIAFREIENWAEAAISAEEHGRTEAVEQALSQIGALVEEITATVDAARADEEG